MMMVIVMKTMIKNQDPNETLFNASKSTLHGQTV